MELPEHLKATVQKYGEVPTRRRTVTASPSRVLDLQSLRGGLLGAAGLVWNSKGEVLLIREHPLADGQEIWTTPGGMALEGEEPEETFLREVREETGIEAEILDLTYVFDFTVTDGREEVRGFFFQFVGATRDCAIEPGRGVLEVRWFDELPADMAFRDDYLPVMEPRGRGFVVTDE